MKTNYLTTAMMKSLKYILAISCILALSEELGACYSVPDSPVDLHVFRTCSDELKTQYKNGCRLDAYDKEQNCLLWQSITSASIPVEDIRQLVYSAHLEDLKRLSTDSVTENKFAQWLLKPEHSEDLEYLLVAKEIEEIRRELNDPWYYACDGDEEHVRLTELELKCREYTGKRHAARYALQLVRRYFAIGDFTSCIDLWETSVSKMPQDVVTDMIASYVGGAYYRQGNKDKAIELYTLAQDEHSLSWLCVKTGSDKESKYTDSRIRAMESIFDVFPNSPYLSARLQDCVSQRESFVAKLNKWGNRSSEDYMYGYASCDSAEIAENGVFDSELKQFVRHAISSDKCRQKAMWQYALAYLSYLDGDENSARTYLAKAERSKPTPLISESIRAFRFLLDATHANNSQSYRAKLYQELKWIDRKLEVDVAEFGDNVSFGDNQYNYPICYWQDVIRRVLLAEACPALKKSGNTTLALQLANYATNHIYQLLPNPEVYVGTAPDGTDIKKTMSYDEYRWDGFNWSDYRCQFFEWINDSSADVAAKYALSIVNPKSDLDKFLNDRSYTDTDYIFDIVGTLYLREMNYTKASEWLAKVSENHQARTNLAKSWYFRRDPFKCQLDKQLIADSTDYKLRFANEMVRLEKLMNSDAEVNRRANAKIRYAIGMHNSFNECWYLTAYGQGDVGDIDSDIAENATKRADGLWREAMTEFTDPEMAAQAQLTTLNFATIMKLYPHTQVATRVRTGCDYYGDWVPSRSPK